MLSSYDRFINTLFLLDVLCGVLHVFPPRFIEKTKRNLQDFVVVNEERRPLILTLWEEFLQSEASYLTQNVHTTPIILGMRLCVNTFYGLSIGTVPNSTILFDPPIPQANKLKIWLEDNKNYVESIVTQKLYEKANLIIQQPSSHQIRKISQLLSLSETVKSFWVKANLKITDSMSRLYFLACPGCSKASGAAYGFEFTCFYCNHDFTSPKPLLRFQAELFDGTGNLLVYIEHKEAESLLGMSGEEIVELELKKELTHDDINEKFKDQHFLFQVRALRSEFRGKTIIRNTVITCLPAPESSSSYSSEEKNSSLHAKKKLINTVAMLESQESTSGTKKDNLSSGPAEHHTSSSSKRSHDSSDDFTSGDIKHAKEN